MPRKPNSSPQAIALLAALAARALDWRHGYDLSKQTGIKPGTLYPLLIRLSDQGYLEARWEPSDTPHAPPRHAYRLTKAGQELARASVPAEATGTVSPGFQPAATGATP